MPMQIAEATWLGKQIYVYWVHLLEMFKPVFSKVNVSIDTQMLKLYNMK